MLQRIHNPHNYECGCDPDCWCRRTRIGRVVKWWFPARHFRIRHKNSFFDGMTWDEIREWKREQSEKGMYPMVVQPDFGVSARSGTARASEPTLHPTVDRGHVQVGHLNRAPAPRKI